MSVAVTSCGSDHDAPSSALCERKSRVLLRVCSSHTTPVLLSCTMFASPTVVQLASVLSPCTS